MGAAPSVLVVCGGGRIRDEVRTLPGEWTVIAADAGADEALRQGLYVDLLVGDMDSVSSEAIQQVEASGGAIHRHPRDKDTIDLELALDEALALAPERVLVVGGDGGRFDFLLVNALVLAHPRLSAVEVDGWFGAATVHVVRGTRQLHGTRGELLSLVAVGGPARRVRTRGLRWALEDADLPAGVGLGVSNELLQDTVEIRVEDGVVLAIRPGVSAT